MILSIAATAMVGALVALEMAKNLVAATLHLEVSGMYIDIQYSRLFGSSLRSSHSSHTLTCINFFVGLNRGVHCIHNFAAQCAHGRVNFVLDTVEMESEDPSECFEAKSQDSSACDKFVVVHLLHSINLDVLDAAHEVLRIIDTVNNAFH